MLDVGTVVYLLDKKTQRVVPCLVVEKVCSVSLDGERTHHIVQTPTQKTLKIEEYKSPWFATIDEARDFLMNAATSLVNETIQLAEKSREKTFPQTSAGLVDEMPQEQQRSEETVSPLSVNELNSEEIYVDLGNGQKAKVNFPESVK